MIKPLCFGVGFRCQPSHHHGRCFIRALFFPPLIFPKLKFLGLKKRYVHRFNHVQQHPNKNLREKLGEVFRRWQRKWEKTCHPKQQVETKILQLLKILCFESCMLKDIRVKDIKVKESVHRALTDIPSRVSPFIKEKTTLSLTCLYTCHKAEILHIWKIQVFYHAQKTHPKIRQSFNF